MGAIITQETKELYLNMLQVNRVNKNTVDERNEAGELVRSDRKPAVIVVETFLSRGGTSINRVEKSFLYSANDGDIFDQAYAQILPDYDVAENVFEAGQVAI